MARPLRMEYSGAFYHVTSRGNEQKDIFKSDVDREKFLSYLGNDIGVRPTHLHTPRQIEHIDRVS